MSQYVNRIAVSMAEVTTITFIHEMTVEGQTTATPQAMVSMPHEAFKDAYRVMGEIIKQYEDQSKATSPQRKGMN